MTPKSFTALVIVSLAAGCASAPPKAPAPTKKGPPQPMAYDDDRATLPIKRAQTDSQGKPVLIYTPLALKGAYFSFIEREGNVSAEGTLFDFSIHQTEAYKLKSATITLRPELIRYEAAPPGGSVAEYHITNATTYTDLNGDSILDIMVQYIHPHTKKFILLTNQWVQVKPYGKKSRDEHPELVTGLSGEKYEFADSGWRLVPAK
jgi:hypothetical protein